MHVQLAILHAQNTYNNGSFMLLINFIWYYVKHTSPNARITFWVELDGTDNYRRIMQALPDGSLPDKHISIQRLPFAITSADHSSLLRKTIRLYAKFYLHPRGFKKLGIDTVIILGGDDISEYYKKWLILSDLYRIHRYSKFFNTVLAGHTIGPFRGLREKVAAKCLSKTMIFSRDDLTAAYLKDRLRIPRDRIHRSADLSFPELPVPAGESGILAACGLMPEEYIILVPGGHYSLYTKDKHGYIQCWVRLVKDLLELDDHLTKKIVFLPHVTRPEDDRGIIHQIRDSLGDAEGARDRICMAGEELFPHQLRQILGCGYLTITSRMHAALSTFQMKKPAIALGYSVKYDGVIGMSVRCPELVVHCSKELFTEPGRFSQVVLDKIGHVDHNYQQIKTHLERRIPELEALAEDQIRTIARISQNKPEQ